MQVDGVPEKSTERFVGSAGLVKIGEEFVPARWLHLQSECADGSIKYDPVAADGEVIKMPLKTCIQRDLSSDIDVRRTCIHVGKKSNGFACRRGCELVVKCDELLLIQ